MNASSYEASAQQLLGSGERILVVDDEEIIRALLEEILLDEGFEVATAGNGNEAIEMLQGDQFDLIISDVVMPGMSGIEVLQAAFRIDPEYPVIMITGYPSVETAVKLVNLGAADYITKPFNIDSLKLTISKALRSRKGAGHSQDMLFDPEPSTVDPVTGVHNYSRFSQILTREVESAKAAQRSCSIAVFWIDEFDRIKARRPGEDDRVLKEFVIAANTLLEAEDSLGRTSEAEFGVILSGASPQQASIFANRLRDALPSDFSISGGVATYPQDASDADLLLRTARVATQTAKSRGGDRIVVLN